MPLFTSALVIAAVASPVQAPRPDTVGFVARLGVDTVAVERVVRTSAGLTADVVIRSPRTMVLRHELAAGRLTEEVRDPRTGAVVRTTTWERAGDSVRITTVEGAERTSRMITAPPGALPFIDLVHWPFDLLLESMRRRDMTSWDAPMITGSRLSQFPLAFQGRDSATVTHPTRGTMRVRTTPTGGIATLDAGATTRALVVTRGPAPDIAALTRDYLARDAAGRGMGQLSGRGEEHATVLGAEITVDYGTPEKRGREIWGGLVRYGQLWRTGANQATHFTTSRDLQFGDLRVPAGTYTLFSIPAADGGMLIINRQTGQNGQTYNEDRDLGRVRLVARRLPEVVEVFTIKATEERGHGLLRLQWDRTELVAEFTVPAGQ